MSITTNISLQLPSPVQKLDSEWLQSKKISLLVKRDDLIHEHISGNKWRKLKYNLIHAQNEKKEGIITFGGAYSNHLAATAFACKAAGLKSVGVVRGEDADENNSTLLFCKQNGMTIKKISREDYKAKEEDGFLKLLHHEFQNHFVVPGGGANFYGVNGCMEIITEEKTESDVICCACGTGTTLAGITAALNENQRAIGFPVLKGGEFLAAETEKHLWYFSFDSEWVKDKKKQFEIQPGYHFGGYAKTNPELFHFIEKMKTEYHLPTDPVYTSKMLFGVFDLIEKNYFSHGTRIMVIHTGGMQGWSGMAGIKK